MGMQLRIYTTSYIWQFPPIAQAFRQVLVHLEEFSLIMCSVNPYLTERIMNVPTLIYTAGQIKN